ncbi:hypothetical protein PGT21_018705 [Puccinia graminis f. sp. tritici]|uniref:IBR domain-containing protein n=1 Tax=Puccinia graminis f. sp. tritici TaxID=56615 RepID=A0A5B0Q647_PUCGR|nr:hypothetical protein PGT21_018705 [Puccinia graminis f. sp. tritici]
MRALPKTVMICLLHIVPLAILMDPDPLLCHGCGWTRLYPTLETPSWEWKSCAQFRRTGTCTSGAPCKRWFCSNCGSIEWKPLVNTPICTIHSDLPQQLVEQGPTLPNARFGMNDPARGLLVETNERLEPRQRDADGKFLP